MPERDLQEHRIQKLEEDVKTLYSKVNTFAVTSAEMSTKLDNVLLTLGEVKESIKSVQNRPSRLWDKLIFGFLTAVGTGLGAAFLLLFK